MTPQGFASSSLAALSGITVVVALLTAPAAQAQFLAAPSTGPLANRAYIATPSLRLGDNPSGTLRERGPAVRRLQQILQADGFLAGDVHGIFDRATQDAVRELQEFANLRVDGVVGAATWEALLRRTDPYNVNLSLNL